MEVSVFITISITLLSLVITTFAWRVINWLWLRPKRLEKLLRKQGLNGTSYRFLFGDIKENFMLIKEAMSKPIDLADDITPRVYPFQYQTFINYGKDSFEWSGPTPTVNIMKSEHLKEIFAKFGDFPKPYSNPIARLLASGLVTCEGEKWAKHRKIINPAFHMEKLKRMLPSFYLSCTEMLSKWESLVANDTSHELDVWPYLQDMTRDVISRTAFGSSYEDGRRIFQLQKEQAILAIKVIKTLYIPGWRFVPTNSNKRIKEIDKEIQDLLKDMICNREDMMARGEAPNDDLLGTLLESNREEMKGNNSVGMSINDVIEECKLFYLAGQETTSVLLVWTLVLLSKFPNWQAQAREEVLRVFGNNNPDFDGLAHLKIVTMILNEVLRLYPPIIALARAVPKETKLGNLLLPAGVEVSVPTILVHYDLETWGEDAKEFNPERFAEGVSKATKGRVSFFPFGWGPRICVGQNFAMIEAKMALALILQRFTFELSPSYIHAPFTIVTLQPQHGAQIILHKC